MHALDEYQRIRRPPGPSGFRCPPRSRGKIDSAAGTKPLHLVSAWASTQRLVLCQEAVDVKENECTAILAILERLPVNGALVTIDAIATNPTIAEAITLAGVDYVLALKRNQPTLHDEVAAYFDDPETTGLQTIEITDKDHGPIEIRTYSVCHDVSWLSGEKHYPGEPRFHALKCLVKTTTRTEWRGKVTNETRYFISSALLTPQRAAEARVGGQPCQSCRSASPRGGAGPTRAGTSPRNTCAVSLHSRRTGRGGSGAVGWRRSRGRKRVPCRAPTRPPPFHQRPVFRPA